ncbi:MAG: hypothetical protein MUP85_15415 [Candidatus Lokiarchaeota archaeon]|nr:hypothetical protein [Candidatus Lokiarchaeota archaeon]
MSMKENSDKSVNEKINNVINVLKKTKAIIKNTTTDVAWSRFENEEGVIEALDDHMEKLISHDFSAIWDLILFFAPTGSLQEISISSGWGDDYLTLASECDTAINELKQNIK